MKDPKTIVPVDQRKLEEKLELGQSQPQVDFVPQIFSAGISSTAIKDSKALFYY